MYIVLIYIDPPYLWKSELLLNHPATTCNITFTMFTVTKTSKTEGYIFPHPS